MSTVTETGLIARWLYATLTGDGTLAALVPGGWHRWQGARGAAYPLGVYRFQGGSDLAAIGADRRVWVEAVYAVYAVGAGVGVDVETAAARIDALLLGKQATQTGGLIISCTRDAPLELAPIENGIQREIAGGTYRIRAQRS